MNVEFINLKRFTNFIKHNMKNADENIQSYINDLILRAYKGERSYRLNGYTISFNYECNYDDDTDEDYIILEF